MPGVPGWKMGPLLWHGGSTGLGYIWAQSGVRTGDMGAPTVALRTLSSHGIQFGQLTVSKLTFSVPFL